MATNSPEFKTFIKDMVTNLYKQGRKDRLAYPFRDINEIMPMIRKETDGFETIRAFILQNK